MQEPRNSNSVKYPLYYTHSGQPHTDHELLQRVPAQGWGKVKIFLFPAFFLSKLSKEAMVARRRYTTLVRNTLTTYINMVSLL